MADWGAVRCWCARPCDRCLSEPGTVPLGGTELEQATTTTSACPTAQQPPGGSPNPGLPPSTDASAWRSEDPTASGWTIWARTSATRRRSWSPRRALPASFGFSSTVVGGQVAYPSPPEIVPQPGSPSSSGTPMWVHVQFSVSCISGKPSLHLYELRANA
jgi:hypothetical protein